MAMNGTTCNTIQTGWVTFWKRLIRVIPWVTIGMIASDEAMVPIQNGIPNR